MAPHSSTLAWKISWMEEPGRLQSMGSQRIRHNWATSLSLFTFMHWRRQWHPPLQCSCLENPRDRGAWWAAIYGVAQSWTWLKRLSSSSSNSVPGEGNGNPLQYSCLENPVDGGAWWAAIYGVTQSRIRLRQLDMHACTGEGNGNPLLYSCLESPRDRGAWWAAIYGVSQSRTWPKWLSSSSSSNSVPIYVIKCSRRKSPTQNNYGKYKESFLVQMLCDAETSSRPKSIKKG